jgi:hypothetical protein
LTLTQEEGGVWLAAQIAGGLNPPAGSLTKSRQTHIRWQQNEPVVVGHVQTKPPLQ